MIVRGCEHFLLGFAVSVCEDAGCRSASNTRASACAAFGRSGEAGPMGTLSLGTGFFVSKRADLRDEVAGRFGGTKRWTAVPDQMPRALFCGARDSGVDGQGLVNGALG